MCGPSVGRGWGQGAAAVARFGLGGPSLPGHRSGASFQIHRARPPHSSGRRGVLTQGPWLLYSSRCCEGLSVNNLQSTSLHGGADQMLQRHRPCHAGTELPTGRKEKCHFLVLTKRTRYHSETHVYASHSGRSWPPLLSQAACSGRSQVGTVRTDYQTRARRAFLIHHHRKDGPCSPYGAEGQV